MTNVLAMIRSFFPSEPKPVRSQGLGTFLGVFTPTILTILGVIMYLRFGWVLGHAGLWGTVAIVCIANGITLLTTLSLSAVATNGRIGVGGAYYIISRSLGLEIGGAIGLPLFLSQALSVTLYAFGLAESFTIVWPGLPVQPTAFVIILLVVALAFRGADAALRAQLPIIGLIALSLLALTLGASGAEVDPAAQANHMSGEYSFWAIFAVFFPAVTGIMAGLGLSGDLADPERALPRGSLIACLTGFAIYLALPFILWSGADALMLRTEAMVWSRIAPLGMLLILPGLWGAVFSSAVGSVLGAPRTLQAMAADHLAPQWLGKTKGAGAEPVMGLWATLVIALGATLLGDLNAVATVVSMFFLTVYGVVNLVAALEEWSQDPSWRPTLSVPWQLSLLGALGCVGTMLLISPGATLIAITAEAALFVMLRRRRHRPDWGNVWRGMFEMLIRWSLFQLAKRPMTPRNWRPYILVFVERLEERLPLLRYADWFTEDRGVITVCELVEGDVLTQGEAIVDRKRAIARVLRRERLPLFGEVDVVDRIDEGIVTVAQANGMAGLQSNTVMMGCPESPERLAVFLGILRRLQAINKSVIIGRVREEPEEKKDADREIHVWWGGLQRNGDLMLLLAYLLAANREWKSATLRVLSVASNELMKKETERALAKILPELRTEAEIEVMVKEPEVTIKALIQKRSAQAEAVLLGLDIPEAGQELPYAERLLDLVEGLTNFFLIRNCSLFVGDLLEVPETKRINISQEDAR